ncbi:MAG: hypothetical protein ACR2KT_02360 [Methylocella sp.]
MFTAFAGAAPASQTHLSAIAMRPMKPPAGGEFQPRRDAVLCGMAQAMRASLLAKATTTAFLRTLARCPRNHPPRGVSLLESAGRTALAAWISSLRS